MEKFLNFVFSRTKELEKKYAIRENSITLTLTKEKLKGNTEGLWLRIIALVEENAAEIYVGDTVSHDSVRLENAIENLFSRLEKMLEKEDIFREKFVEK